jgi:hypothetical protein
MLTGGRPADRAVVAKSVWVTTGYVLKLTVGEAASAAALFVEPERTDNAVVRDYKSLWGCAQSSNYSTNLSDEEAAALLSALVAADTGSEAKAMFIGEGLLSGLLTSDFIKGQIAKLVLPFLLNKLKEWILTGGLDNFLGDLIGNSQSFSAAVKVA